MDDQMIADEFVGATPDGPHEFTSYVGDESSRVNGVWLAAPKTTDALYLAPTRMPPGLSIERVVGPRTLTNLNGNEVLNALAATAVRAAALSATFILVNRAALELDVDPEEFDVIEPRLFRLVGGPAVPILQIADHLVNGAGFCDALGAIDPATGAPLIGALLRSAISDQDQYPLNEFTRDNHEQACEQACYRCLLRYRNQPFHALLDWRLGLAFLGALADANYRCGLDGNFNGPALEMWSGLVGRDMRRLERQFGRIETRKVDQLWAARFEKGTRWGVVSHPLWDPVALDGCLGKAAAALDGDPFTIIDSFNLARRPVTIRRALLERA